MVDPASGQTMVGFWSDLFISGVTRVRMGVGGDGQASIATLVNWGLSFDFRSGVDLNAMNGGGNGVIGLYKATTAPTGSAGGGNAGVLFCDPTTVALKYRSPGTGGQLQTTLAQANQGTVNTQALVKDGASGTVRTVNSAAGVALASYTFPANCSARIEVITICKATTAGGGVAVGDTYTSKRSLGIKTIAGVLSQVGATNAIDTNSDASMAGVVVVASLAGTTVTWVVGTVATATVDSFAEMTVLIN
jgi:hypothetical protein